MNKKDHKIHKQSPVEVSSTETLFSFYIKKTLLFITLMGASFVITVGVVRFAPSLIHKVKNRSFPSFTLFSNWGVKKKIVFSGNEHFSRIDPMLIKENIDAKKTQRIQLVDIRSEAEYDNGHIKGAVNHSLYTDFRLPYQSVVDISLWAGEVKNKWWRAEEIILYGYSPDADIIQVAAEQLRKLGTRTKILSIGYSEWQGGIWNWIAGGDLNGTLNINDYIERK